MIPKLWSLGLRGIAIKDCVSVSDERIMGMPGVIIMRGGIKAENVTIEEI